MKSRRAKPRARRTPGEAPRAVVSRLRQRGDWRSGEQWTQRTQCPQETLRRRIGGDTALPLLIGVKVREVRKPTCYGLHIPKFTHHLPKLQAFCAGDPPYFHTIPVFSRYGGDKLPIAPLNRLGRLTRGASSTGETPVPPAADSWVGSTGETPVPPASCRRPPPAPGQHDEPHRSRPKQGQRRRLRHRLNHQIDVARVNRCR